MSLHEELDRLAEEAPVTRPRADTWAQAQRARKRERLAVGGAAVLVAAVVTLVAVLATGVLPLPADRSGPAGPTGADTDLAVPDRIHAAPSRVAAREDDGSWMREEVSGDLAVGPAAAAYVMAEGLPVVVDAVDGEHHLLDVPGFLGNDLLAATATGAGLAVSPDGRSLAWGYADVGPVTVTEPVPSGIRVADLVTGELREMPLAGGEGTAVTDLSWSPDGRWLAWAGERYAEWTPSSIGGSSPVAGRVEVADGRVEEMPSEGLRGGDVTIAIDDRGVVVVAAGVRLVSWDGRDVETLTVGAGEPAGSPAVSPSGEAVALGSPDAGAVRFLGRATGEVETREVAPAAGAAGDVVPLGWLDAGLAMVRWTPDAVDEDAGLVVVGPSTPPSRVAVVEPGAGGSLSVAVDLMSRERPTVDRPSPDFAWSPEQQVWLVLGIIGMATGLGVVLWRRRRAGLAGGPSDHRGAGPRGAGSVPRHDLPQ